MPFIRRYYLVLRSTGGVFTLVDLVESELLLKGAYTYTPGAIGRLWLLASCHQRRRSLPLSPPPESHQTRGISKEADSARIWRIRLEI